MALNRRLFLGSLAATGALLQAPTVFGQAKPKVVVIGGGAGGATAARYLAKDSQGALEVTLVEANPIYTTCFFSNLYLGGFQSFDSLQHGYETLGQSGVTVVIDQAVGIDRDRKAVILAGGQILTYDRLVLAPGIDFVEGSVQGWSLADAQAMPHAYQAGPQTQLLKAQIEAMPKGGAFAMVAPANPYRCPPGPYERVSMVAHLLQQTNPTAKIVIADPKASFSKQALFEEGWNTHYPGMIDWVGPDFGGDKVEVRVAAKEILINGEVTKVDAANIIPGQVAGKIAAIAGITDKTGWAPVHAQNMQSKIDANIFVLGDAAAQGDMPKSAFSANSQAKVAANAIRGELTGAKVFPARYNNTCWSLIAVEDGVKVGASYRPTAEKIATDESFISQVGETTALRKATYEESLGWYRGITSDIFG